MEEIKIGGKKWQSDWKSPVSLGIFFAGAGLAFFVVAWVLLNIIGSYETLKSQSSSAMTEQEMQQIEQSAASAPATTGSTGSAATH